MGRRIVIQASQKMINMEVDLFRFLKALDIYLQKEQGFSPPSDVEGGSYKKEGIAERWVLFMNI